MQTRLLVPFVAAVLVTGCGFTTQPLSEERTRQIAAEVDGAHAAMLDAAQRVEAEALGAMFADEGRFLFNGSHLTNQEAREMTRRAYARLSAQELDIAEQRVTVLGPDVGVVSGHGTVASIDTAGVRSEPVNLVWTFVWARRDGQWRVVDSHQSFLPPES